MQFILATSEKICGIVYHRSIWSFSTHYRKIQLLYLYVVLLTSCFYWVFCYILRGGIQKRKLYNIITSILACNTGWIDTDMNKLIRKGGTNRKLQVICVQWMVMNGYSVIVTIKSTINVWQNADYTYTPFLHYMINIERNVCNYIQEINSWFGSIFTSAITYKYK